MAVWGDNAIYVQVLGLTYSFIIFGSRSVQHWRCETVKFFMGSSSDATAVPARAAVSGARSVPGSEEEAASRDFNRRMLLFS